MARFLVDDKNIFSSPKFNTMEELHIIRSKRGDKRAYPSKKKTK